MTRFQPEDNSAQDKKVLVPAGRAAGYPTGLDGDCDGTDWLGGAYGDYCVIDGDPADDLLRNPQSVLTDSAWASDLCVSP
jgi:hypothetical protein